MYLIILDDEVIGYFDKEEQAKDFVKDQPDLVVAKEID